MKPSLSITQFALIAALALLAMNAWHPQTGAAAEPTAPVENACATGRTVQVSGSAVINVTPDRALLQLGVQTNGTTPDSTQNANFLAIQRVVNAVRGVGIDAKDIATDFYIVYPVYDNYNALEIKGYRIDNTVSVTVRDVNLADDVILAALKVGANEVQDVQFYTSELRGYRDQARSLAMKAAGEKAQALAGAGGAQAGCLLSASENIYSYYFGSWRGGRTASAWAQNVIQNAAPTQAPSSSSDDSPLSLGQIAVRAEVSASYSLK
jgi:uncharacterized protein